MNLNLDPKDNRSVRISGGYTVTHRLSSILSTRSAFLEELKNTSQLKSDEDDADSNLPQFIEVKQQSTEKRDKEEFPFLDLSLDGYRSRFESACFSSSQSNLQCTFFRHGTHLFHRHWINANDDIPTDCSTIIHASRQGSTEKRIQK